MKEGKKLKSQILEPEYRAILEDNSVSAVLNIGQYGNMFLTLEINQKLGDTICI